MNVGRWLSLFRRNVRRRDAGVHRDEAAHMTLMVLKGRIHPMTPGDVDLRSIMPFDLVYARRFRVDIHITAANGSASLTRPLPSEGIGV